ncbi:DDE superfamily endonuclease domain-containing protein [Hirsutella rhossiliensis]|uniref:DDE superfamily endonuclease domain-containing protein n=1 Tax=Hirsutella rhossiliensis TaxID=111463 RepID=A0A9P8MLF2_9HYPO|nr:DDE superfamily endonuclease domain-containing protein [Hirsutella rhossiliensis]KAH0957159.1 DDE superfamily endonuclease domain-containing protein [Hirsutella rhossiliensis]
MNGLNWPKPNLNRENWSLKILNRDPKNSIHLIHPSFKIFKKFTFCHLSTWYEDSDIPRDWVISTSDNGWTTNERGLEWIRHFDSHHSTDFELYCKGNNIVTLCMPPHSSHILQPLDVGCFGPLKQAYGRQIEKKMRAGATDADTLGRGSRKTRTLGF